MILHLDLLCRHFFIFAKPTSFSAMTILCQNHTDPDCLADPCTVNLYG